MLASLAQRERRRLHEAHFGDVEECTGNGLQK
jgi:hypothetical protein